MWLKSRKQTCTENPTHKRHLLNKKINIELIGKEDVG